LASFFQAVLCVLSAFGETSPFGGYSVFCRSGLASFFHLCSILILKLPCGILKRKLGGGAAFFSHILFISKSLRQFYPFYYWVRFYNLTTDSHLYPRIAVREAQVRALMNTAKFEESSNF